MKNFSFVLHNKIHSDIFLHIQNDLNDSVPTKYCGNIRIRINDVVTEQIYVQVGSEIKNQILVKIISDEVQYCIIK